MKRLLIAILALLTGLAVQAAPAAARTPGLAIGAEVDPGSAVCASKATRGERVAVVARESWQPLEAAHAPLVAALDPWPAAPTVRLGPDRARE